jgi:hypothetical protein
LAPIHSPAACDHLHSAEYHFDSPASNASTLPSTNSSGSVVGAVVDVKRRCGQRVSGLTHTEVAHDAQLAEAGVSLIKFMWADCYGTFYDNRKSFNAHCRAAHKIQSSQSCQWADCSVTCSELKRHAWTHMHATEVKCDVCHDVLSRSDALRRHKRAGTCLRCPKEGCGAQFANLEERQVHEFFCDPAAQKAAQGGKQRCKGKGKGQRSQGYWPY